MESAELCRIFKELVQLPSPSKHERQVANYIAKFAKDCGFDVHEDSAADAVGGTTGNLIITAKESGKIGKKNNIIFSAHMDTVEFEKIPIMPQFDGMIVRSDGDNIVGADDKTGISALLMIMKWLSTESTVKHGKIRFIFTVCEEIALRGALALDSEWLEGYDLGVVLDSSLPNQIVLAAPTRLKLSITVKGIGGHAAYPECKINAAAVLAKAISRIPTGRLDAHSTANVGIIKSGNIVNVIPESAYAEYEIRSHRKELLEFHLKQALFAIEGAVRESRIMIADADDADDGLYRSFVDVEVETCCESYQHDKQSKGVKRVEKAIQKTGLDCVYGIEQGGSDANVFIKHGLETILIGCGIHSAHSVEEYADLSETLTCVEILKSLITE